MKKILFVTGDTQVIPAWREFLTAQGFDVDVALSGHEAVRRTVSGMPDLVLLGAIEISPEVFAAPLKLDDKTAHIPVLSLAPEDAAKPESAMLRIQAALSSHRVLVAEDDRQMANVLEMVLRKSGYDVRVTYDGVETLREIKAFRPRLLVLDVMLPIVDGFHVCQTMNEDHSYDPRPKVLIVSGRGSDWDQNLGAACGAEEYIVKPFKNDYFLSKVREILEAEGRS